MYPLGSITSLQWPSSYFAPKLTEEIFSSISFLCPKAQKGNALAIGYVFPVSFFISNSFLIKILMSSFDIRLLFFFVVMGLQTSQLSSSNSFTILCIFSRFSMFFGNAIVPVLIVFIFVFFSIFKALTLFLKESLFFVMENSSFCEYAFKGIKTL